MVQQYNVYPCKATSPFSFVSTSPPVNASKAFCLVSWNVVHCPHRIDIMWISHLKLVFLRFAIWLRVRNRAQTASLLSHTLHFTESSPSGSEKRGSRGYTVNTVKGVLLNRLSKTLRHSLWRELVFLGLNGLDYFLQFSFPLRGRGPFFW